MSIIPSVLSAIAATIAAVLAGLTLYLAGQREHRQWIRHSLVDSYVSYLTASFDSGARKAFEARLRGESLAALGDHQRQAAEVHGQQTAILTRLRMIAPSAVVTAAEALHEADHAVVDAVLDAPAMPDERIWEQLRSTQWSARSAFVDQARSSLGLGSGAQIGLIT